MRQYVLVGLTNKGTEGNYIETMYELTLQHELFGLLGSKYFVWSFWVISVDRIQFIFSCEARNYINVLITQMKS